MMKARSVLFAILSLGLFAPLTGGADETAAEPLAHLGTVAKPVKRTAPIYPKSLLDRGQQGWVKLSYVVTESGEVIDPVVEESSGPRAFERAALKTVQRWSYEPATWDGKPVQQCQTKVMISFAIEGSEATVSRRFYNRYYKIEKAIEKKDIEKAGKLLDNTFKSYDMTLSELTSLWALRAQHAALTGDEEMQLKAIRKATASNGRWINQELYPQLLYVRTVLELQNSNLPEALDTFDKLVSLDSDMPKLEDLRTYIDRVRNIIDSESIIAVSGRIDAADDCDDCSNNWHYDPLRRKVRIAEVDGELGNIELRCAWRRIVDKARPGKSWDLPEDWGDCSIIVFGEPGSSFTLYEEPSA